MDPKQIEEVRTKLKDAHCNGALALFEVTLQMSKDGRPVSYIQALDFNMGSSYIGVQTGSVEGDIAARVDDFGKIPEASRVAIDERLGALADSMKRVIIPLGSVDSHLPQERFDAPFNDPSGPLNPNNG